MATNWADFKKSREAVVRDEGQYICLLDNNGEFLFGLPKPVEFSAPETRLTPESLKMTIPVVNSVGELHPVVRELVGDDIAEITQGGEFVPHNGPARLVLVERAGGRSVYKVKFVVIKGGSHKPSLLEIHGLDIANVLWELPCPSYRNSWKTAPYKMYGNDPAVTFKENHELSLLQFGAMAWTFSEQGPAEEVIRNIIRGSIDAVSIHEGWTKRHVIVDETATGLESPEVTIRLEDNFIGETVADYALHAGVNISSRLALPGDKPVNGKSIDYPVIVVTVAQTEGGVND